MAMEKEFSVPISELVGSYCAEDESKWFAALVMPESFNSVVRMMETKENLLYEEYCSVHKCLEAHVGRTLEEYYDDVHHKNNGVMTAEDFECQHGDVTEWIGSDKKVFLMVNLVSYWL